MTLLDQIYYVSNDYNKDNVNATISALCETPYNAFLHYGIIVFMASL